MATDEERLREHIRAAVHRNVPQAFLLEFQDRVRRAYPEVYNETDASRTTLVAQKPARLIQDRCFRIDWELHEAASRHGLSASTVPLSNRWHHTYVTSGTFGFTQSYVQAVGALPQPAKFRDDLAEAARCPRFAFDYPDDLHALKDFYALLAHNPVGRKFAADAQQLGSLQLCVPCEDMKSWVFAESVSELIASYPQAPAVDKDKGASPVWKAKPQRKTNGRDDAPEKDTGTG